MESLILNQFKKLEDQHKSNIFNKIYESNFTNLYAGLLALCAIHIPIIILDYLKLKKGMWEINLGYKYIFFMHLGLYGFLFFSLSFYLFLKKYNYSFKTKNVFCFVVSLLLQLWSALFSSIDQMIFGDISIFYISIFCLPVFFKFRAELEFFKLALAEISSWITSLCPLIAAICRAADLFLKGIFALAPASSNNLTIS